MSKKGAAAECPFTGIFRRLRVSESARHFRLARREIILGVRTMLDGIIESLEEGEKKDKKVSEN